jgi:hypothetical protein
LDIDELHIKDVCNKLNISSHTYFVGILALAVKNYSNSDNIVIYDIFSGRDDNYKNTLGFFSFGAQINILRII